MHPFSIKISYMEKTSFFRDRESISLMDLRREKETWLVIEDSGFAGSCPGILREAEFGSRI